MFKKNLVGWVESNFDIYKIAYSTYGGGINTHPSLIEHMIKNYDCKGTFYHLEIRGVIVGACYINDKGKIGLDVWRKFPITYDEVLIPLSREVKSFLPLHTNRLSMRNKRNVLNTSYNLLSKNKLCVVKDSFSKKTTKNRRNQMNKFIAAGGTVRSVEEFSQEELTTIYITLFKKRFGETVRCYTRESLLDLMTHFKHMIFGHILFIKDSIPCAFDLIIKAECQNWFYFDVPNGGVDPEYNYLSPGSVLMWLNINAAKEMSRTLSKECIFTLGLYQKNWEYKLLWCDAVPLGKVIYF